MEKARAQPEHIPEDTKRKIREVITQSTAAAFKDPAVQARFQRWMTERKKRAASGE